MSRLEKLFTIRSRYGPQRTLTITREGRFYGAVTLGIGAAAINTGNNLLYLVLGLQVATIVISGILSEAAITGLALESLGARDARVGESASWLLRLTKRQGRIPSYALTLAAADGPAQGAQAGVLRLAPGSSETVELRFAPTRRGRFVTRQLTLSTRFPFGLFEKSRVLDAPQEIFVYPRRGAPPLPTLPPSREDGPRRTHRVGRGAEPLSLRPYDPSDGLARIHWRKSAQAGSFIAVNREREELPRVAFRVELRAEADSADLARLELELERAAAGAEHALDQGLGVSLTLGGHCVEAPADAAGRRLLLRALAAAEPELAP